MAVKLKHTDAKGLVQSNDAPGVDIGTNSSVVLSGSTGVTIKSNFNSYAKTLVAVTDATLALDESYGGKILTGKSDGATITLPAWSDLVAGWYVDVLLTLNILTDNTVIRKGSDVIRSSITTSANGHITLDHALNGTTVTFSTAGGSATGDYVRIMRANVSTGGSSGAFVLTIFQG